MNSKNGKVLTKWHNIYKPPGPEPIEFHYASILFRLGQLDNAAKSTSKPSESMLLPLIYK
jgi:hypothetical protein